MCASSRPPGPIGPQHLPASTDHAHLLCHRAQATPPTNHHHSLAKAGLQMRRLQRGHDANGAAVARPKMDKVVTLKIPVQYKNYASQWCPQQEERCHNGTTTIATDKSVSEDFRPTQHHACCTFLAKPVARSNSPPHRPHWKKPGAAQSTTSAPPASTNQPPSPTTMAAPDQHRR